MKLIKAVNSSDIKLKDIDVNLQIVDGKIEAVVVTDVDGKFIRVVKDGTYSDNLKVLIEEPKEFETVYKVTVKIDDGVSVYKLKDKDAVERKVMYLGEKDYTVEEIQVEVEKNLLGQKQEVDFDSIPF